MKLKRWDQFIDSVLDGKAMLFVEGPKPDKVFEVWSFEGAKRAIDILTRLRVTNWVLFSVQGHDRSTILMATAMLVRDLIELTGREPDVYAEDRAAYLNGQFPRVDSGEFDKKTWKTFIEGLDLERQKREAATK
jgi:hypothetical protein